MVRFLIFSIWVAFHPVHVSIMSLDYEKTQNRFEVFMRLYYDDFLLDLGFTEEEGEKLVFSSENSYTTDVLMSYINDKVEIFVDDTRTPVTLTNTDLSDNELRLNMYMKADKKPGSILIRNTIMTTIYGDQANMIIVKVDDFEEGVKLTVEETEKKFIIN